MLISDNLCKADADRTVLEYQRMFDTLMAQEDYQRKMIRVGITFVLLALYVRYRMAKQRGKFSSA